MAGQRIGKNEAGQFELYTLHEPEVPGRIKPTTLYRLNLLDLYAKLSEFRRPAYGVVF